MLKLHYQLCKLSLNIEWLIDKQLPSTVYQQLSSIMNNYQLLPTTAKYVLPTTAKYYILPTTTKYYQQIPVLPITTKCYQLLLSITKNNQVLPTTIKYYQQLPNISKYYQVLL